MPTYEYICENCGYGFEYFQSISSEPIRVCPKCGLETIMRKISGGTGLIFKGSGFYITDYVHKNTSRKENPQNRKSNSQESEKKSVKEPPTITESEK